MWDPGLTGKRTSSAPTGTTGQETEQIADSTSSSPNSWPTASSYSCSSSIPSFPEQGRRREEGGWREEGEGEEKELIWNLELGDCFGEEIVLGFTDVQALD